MAKNRVTPRPPIDEVTATAAIQGEPLRRPDPDQVAGAAGRWAAASASTRPCCSPRCSLDQWEARCWRACLELAAGRRRQAVPRRGLAEPGVAPVAQSYLLTRTTVAGLRRRPRAGREERRPGPLRAQPAHRGRGADEHPARQPGRAQAGACRPGAGRCVDGGRHLFYDVRRNGGAAVPGRHPPVPRRRDRRRHARARSSTARRCSSSSSTPRRTPKVRDAADGGRPAADQPLLLPRPRARAAASSSTRSAAASRRS